MKILKYIGAILTAIVVGAALSILTDMVLEKLGVFPPIGGAQLATWMLALALTYRAVYTVLGGYIVARLAPEKPMRLAVILGIIGTVVGAVGAVAGWDLSAHWYPIALTLITLPCTWLGAKIYVEKHI